MGSALDSASLIMYPSGYSDGVLGSAKPTDGSGDFTFTRGSNLSATRVNEQGYIEKGYENLLYPSNDFSVWTDNINNASVTSGQSGYDGTNDAWLLSATNNFSRIGLDISASGVQSFSVYAKASTYNFMRLRADGSATGQCFFDLENGTLGTETNTIESKIESIGNGWYRCSITLSSTTTNVKISAAQANNDLNGTDGSVFIQDAMLNQGLVAYPYIETTTAPVAGGILEDEPRIDFSDGCGHLLLEPSRTNLIPYSEYIDGLGLTDLTTTPNATTSPEGLQNAYKVLTGTAGSEQIESSHTGTSGNTKTQSVYIKADSGVQWIRLIQIRNGFANSASAWFDIQNGVKGSKEENGTTSVVDDATKIEDAGNGWYRLTLVCTDSTNNTIFDTRVRTAIADGSGTRVSNGSYFVWGLQMESDATYPTSYIPTYGVSQTRLRDLCIDGGDSNSISNTNGTMFFDFIHGNAMFGTSDAIGLQGSNGRIILYFSSNSIYGVVQIVDSIGVNSMSAEAFSDGTRYKIAITYNSSEVKLYKNGQLQNTMRGVASDLILSSLNFNAISASSSGQRHNQALVFPTALSDDECIALTTI